jgi:hypothetical protein
MSDHGHARLSPSAAERWLSCPASVGMSENIVAPPGDSHFAAEGTSAHTLAYLKAALAFGKINGKRYETEHKVWKREAEVAGYDTLEMEQHTNTYVQFLQELVDGADHYQIYLERRVDCGVPTVWGTADCIVVIGGVVYVVDFKYGTGVQVDADGNPQLRLYALGALDGYGDVLETTEYVQAVIYQPRLNHISAEMLTADDLRAWRKEVAIPGARLALGDVLVFNPSEAACRWCPAAGECKPRMMHITTQDFGHPDVMTPEELGEARGRVAEIERWCADIKDTAMAKAYGQGIPIPGWKVVRGSGRRYIVDETRAISELLDHGFEPDQVQTTKIKGFGDLEKLVGKKVLPEILGDLIDKTPGSPALVPESDKREAISAIDSAQEDFDTVEDM